MSKATIVTAVVLGCAAGYLGGRLAGPAPRPDADVDVAALEARVADVERDRGRPPSLEGGAPSPGAPGAVREEMRAARLETALLELLESPSPALRTRIAELAKAPPVEKGEGPSQPSEVEQKGIAALFTGVDVELSRWGKTYDLADGRVEELKTFAHGAIQRALDAKRDGATPQQLTALDVEAQAGIRRIVGDPVYVATERARITAEARKGLTWVLASVGLTPEQHAQLDGIVSDSVERALPDVVRFRSVPLPDAERAALQASLQQRRAANWEHFRDDVLTEEQRRRLTTGK